MLKNSITKRFGLSYALSTLTILLGSIMLYFALNKSYILLRSVADTYSPSEVLLQELSYKVSETKMLIKNWVFVSPQSNSPDKIRLKYLQTTGIPNLLSQLNDLSQNWNEEEQKVLKEITQHYYVNMIPAQKEVMELLNIFEDYNNAMLVFSAESLVEDENDPVIMQTNKLILEINEFIRQLSGKTEEVRLQTKKAMDAYKFLIIFIAISMSLGTFLLANFINRSVIKPLKELGQAASLVQRGNFDVLIKSDQDNEIGQLNENFNRMIISLKQQKEELEEFNQLLISSQKKTKESNQTKDKFFNIIAHDLKGPITSFVTITEMLKEQPESISNEKKLHFYNSLFSSASNLEKLLDNLLQWARSQSGKMKINASCIIINDLIKQNLDLITIYAKENNITLTNHITKDISVYADPNLLNTIFRNILNNAIKFTNPNGQIEVSCHNRSDNYIEFRISDSGIGIAQEDIQRLFRIDEETKTIGNSNKKGTGFGLLLCKEFVDQLGGKISVESELEKGSAFIFTIPTCKL